MLLASTLIGLITGCAAAGAPRWTVAVLPSGAEFTLELALTPAARARGYMFREHVDPREGMLFVFDETDVYPFWMKNCKVRLDIIWLDEGFRVVQIAHDQPPCPENGPCPNILPMRAARYVLELAGGTAKKEGLQRGDRLVLLEEPASN